MAQVVNVSPVQVNDDGSSARFISVLNSQLESRRRQEDAMRQAAIKQREDNMKLFGEGAKNLQKYSEIDFLTPVVSNRIIQEETQKLAEAIRNGNAQVDVPLLMLNTSQRIGSLKNYKANVEEAKTRIKELYPSVSDQNIISLANKYFYRQTQNPDGTVSEDVNWDNLPKIQELIMGEFASNPSRYADLPALTNTMSKVIGGIKTTPFKESRKTDPTGTRTISLGVSADRMPFEELIEITDPETKLKTRVPGVKVVPFAGFRRPDGTPYNVISDNSFNTLISSSDKSLPNMLNVKADSMIVDHNTQVIYDRLKRINSRSEKGKPKFDDQALMSYAREQAVGANAEGSVELEKNFPGFVNKYIPSNMDAFVRIAATKAVSDLGRYNPDGTVRVVEYDRGDVKDSPKSAITINNFPNRTDSTINAFDAVANRMGGRPSVLSSVAFGAEIDPFIEFANTNGSRARLGFKYSASDIQLVPNQNGTITVTSGQEQIGTIDRRTVDMMLNKPLGQKAQQSIVEGENKRTGAGGL